MHDLTTFYHPQSELERERMSLELEEEKRAQAEQEKRLQEQAKKIKNLSSIVFCANREETDHIHTKVCCVLLFVPSMLLTSY